MEIHKVQCDKCGKIEKMRRNMIGCYDLPTFWINVDRNFLCDADLCRKCKRKFKRHSKEFFK